MFILRREICAIQLFGRNLLERIPPDARIVVHGPSSHAHMLEVRWEERRYIVFERDLEERTEIWNKPQEEDTD